MRTKQYSTGFSAISKRIQTNQNMAVRKGSRGSHGTLQGQVRLGRERHSMAAPNRVPFYQAEKLLVQEIKQVSPSTDGLELTAWGATCRGPIPRAQALQQGDW